MLDRARRTVLAIINKENRGWMSPSQGDLFFNQAQLEIFEDYFLDYAKWIHKANLRLSNEGYSDIPKLLREKIEVFAENAQMTYNAISEYFEFPSDAYYVNEIYYNDSEVAEVNKKRFRYLKKSILIAPTEDYPVYTRYGRAAQILPNTIVDTVTCDYLRRPKTPKWTFVEVSGNPVFNPSAVDFQDLEIHPSDEPKIVQKVLGYMGIHVREADIVQIMKNEEAIDLQKQQ